MAFNSFEYALLLGVVAALCWSLRQTRQQNIVILLASYVFYASWDWHLVPLLLLTTIVNYFAGRAMATSPRAKTIFIASLIFNLGILGFFKYFNFFVDSAVSLLNAVGIQANPSTLMIILPIGISFYTFELVAYNIDVYRKQLQPENDFLNFALFVGFFPQLLAGPIERGAALLPQIRERTSATPEQVETGLLLILLGLFKKIVIADVAANLINGAAFTNPAGQPAGVVVQAVYLFALQIYADFSAYTDIARGSARLLGIELVANFDAPYLAGNIGEFWARWHISLSTWLRDYIFYPFSRSLLRRYGNKRSILIQIAAHMLTMFVSGLWHGANLTFVLWGIVHGIYLSAHRVLFHFRIVPVKPKSPTGKRVWKLVSILITFHLVLLAWVLFRAPSIRYVPGVYVRLVQVFSEGAGSDVLTLILPVAMLYGVMLVIDVGQHINLKDAFFGRLPGGIRSVVYVTAIVLMIFFALKPYVPFFYFQF